MMVLVVLKYSFRLKYSLRLEDAHQVRTMSSYLYSTSRFLEGVNFHVEIRDKVLRFDPFISQYIISATIHSALKRVRPLDRISWKIGKYLHEQTYEMASVLSCHGRQISQGINPLTPQSDQHLISPYIIDSNHTLSSRE